MCESLFSVAFLILKLESHSLRPPQGSLYSEQLPFEGGKAEMTLSSPCFKNQNASNRALLSKFKNNDAINFMTFQNAD